MSGMLKRSWCTSNKGLTLIEILVAITILSIILLSVYGTFFSVNMAVESTDTVMERYRAVRVFLDLMRREIQGAYLNTASRDNGTFLTLKDRDIYGRKMSEFGFTAFAPYGPGLYALQYEVDTENNELYKKAISFVKIEDAPRMEVLENVDEFEVEVKSGGRWIGTYDAVLLRRLPDVVKIRVTLDMEGEKISFEETVETKLK